MRKKLWLTLGATPILMAPITALSAAPTETTTNNLKAVVELYEQQLPTINTFIDQLIKKYESDQNLKANIESVKNDLTSLFNEVKANVENPDVLSEKLPTFINAFEKATNVLSLLQLANQDSFVKAYNADSDATDNLEHIIAKIKKIADSTISADVNKTLPAALESVIDDFFKFFEKVMIETETYEQKLESIYLGSYFSRMAYSMMTNIKEDWKTLNEKKDTDKTYVFQHIFEFSSKYDDLLEVLNKQQFLFKTLFEKDENYKEQGNPWLAGHINEIAKNDQPFIKAGGLIDLSEKNLYEFDKIQSLNTLLFKAVIDEAIKAGKTDEAKMAALQKENREIKQTANQFAYMVIAFGLSLLVTFIVVLALIIKLTRKEIKGQIKQLNQDNEIKTEENKVEEIKVEENKVEEAKIEEQPKVEEVASIIEVEKQPEPITEKPVVKKATPKKASTTKKTSTTKKSTKKTE